MPSSSVKETHISWLVFVGERVYKVKKPVSFDFLDWSTLAAREDACRREVELNRRLSPDVYLGVGSFLPPDGPPEPVVVMRRLPDEQSLSSLIAHGDPSLSRQVAGIADVLAEFHRRAGRGPDVDRDCGAERVGALWARNLSELRAAGGQVIPAGELDEIASAGERWLKGRAPLVDGRVASGKAVDGHGDLLCDDVFCTPEGLRILDCLEFDPALRHVDVAADLASLAMDLEHHGRPDLAAVLVGGYQSSASDPWPASLTDFWVAYRALVRAKVGCYRAAGSAPADARAIHGDVRRLVSLAASHLGRARIRLVLVGGLPGSGKSTLAAHLGEATGWPVLSTDAVRRETAAVPSGGARGPYGEGPYAPAAVEANYSELLRRAGLLIGGGRSVILDGSWLRRSWRERAETLCRGAYCDLVAIECVAPPAIRLRRIGGRVPGRDLSDATPAVADAMAAAYEPWPGSAPVRTDGSEDETLAAALTAVGLRRPGG